MLTTASITEAEKGAFCRAQGIYLTDLEAWKQQFIKGVHRTDEQPDKLEAKQLRAEVKQLKHELLRKEKALAEASALLLLKKKANLLWGESLDD